MKTEPLGQERNKQSNLLMNVYLYKYKIDESCFGASSGETAKKQHPGHMFCTCV
jgi:hypothetical protein